MKLLSPPSLALAWWVEIYTSKPQEVYYLGPFSSRAEAKISRGAHVETLHRGGTRDIIASVKQR